MGSELCSYFLDHYYFSLIFITPKLPKTIEGGRKQPISCFADKLGSTKKLTWEVLRIPISWKRGYDQTKKVEWTKIHKEHFWRRWLCLFGSCPDNIEIINMRVDHVNTLEDELFMQTIANFNPKPNISTVSFPVQYMVN